MRDVTRRTRSRPSYAKEGGGYKTEKAVYDAGRARRDLQGIDVKPVETETGWVLEEVGEAGFWMFETSAERRDAQDELTAAGWMIQSKGLTKESRPEMEKVSEGFMAAAVGTLQEQGAEDEADALYQLYLDTLHQQSIRKHFLHRKGTTGFSQDALRSFGWNMTRLAHQVAKLEHVPALERLIRGIEQEKRDLAAEAPDTEEQTVADAYLQELQKRHDWIVMPDNAAWTNATSALGFFWYLGATPGAALVNLTQTAIVALPTLAGRFNDWGGSSKALSKALIDVSREGVVDVSLLLAAHAILPVA